MWCGDERRRESTPPARAVACQSVVSAMNDANALPRRTRAHRPHCGMLVNKSCTMVELMDKKNRK